MSFALICLIVALVVFAIAGIVAFMQASGRIYSVLIAAGLAAVTLAFVADRV